MHTLTDLSEHALLVVKRTISIAVFPAADDAKT